MINWIRKNQDRITVAVMAVVWYHIGHYWGDAIHLFWEGILP